MNGRSQNSSAIASAIVGSSGSAVAGKPKLEPLTYTIEEAAQLIGVSRAYLYELVKRDTSIPALHMGRRVFMARSVVHFFVENGRWPSREQPR